MLRLVDPAIAGKEPVRRKNRRARPALTETEQMRLRAALNNLKGLYGSWECLAEVMGVDHKSLARMAKGTDRATASMGMRAAKAAGMSLDRIVAGLTDASVCPTCGAKRGAN